MIKSLFPTKKIGGSFKPSKLNEIQKDINSKSRKASGLDILSFFTNDKNERTLKKSVINLKNSLVETFSVARFLRRSSVGINEQLKNISIKGGGGGGFIGGLFGILKGLTGGMFGFLAKALAPLAALGLKFVLPAVAIGGVTLFAGQTIQNMMKTNEEKGDTQVTAPPPVPPPTTVPMNEGTGRDGTFGEGTYGEGRPSDPPPVEDNRNLLQKGIDFLKGKKTEETTESSQQTQTRQSSVPTGGPPTAEEARVAAALVTEAAGGTASTDVLQVAANRVAADGYGDTLTDVFAAPNQFEGVFKRSIDDFREINSVSDAAKFANVDESVIMQRITDIRNEELRKDSADFVGGALEFRGSPQTVRSVNSDSNPYNDIEEIGTTGIIPDSIHRGGAGDNQFLVGPQDAQLSAPAPINISAAPASENISSVAPASAQISSAASSSNVTTLPSVPSVPAASMPSTNIAVIGAPQQQTLMRKNTGGMVPQSSGAGPTVAFYTPTNSDSISRFRAQKEYNILGTA